MAQYRTKPVVKEARQVTKDGLPFSGEASYHYILEGCGYQVFDELHKTWVNFEIGDWIVKGLQGEFYPVKPDIFAATYESADGESDLTLAVGLLEMWKEKSGNWCPVCGERFGHSDCKLAAFLEKMRGR